MLGLALLAASALASDTSRVEPCTFLDKMAGYPGVNGTRWCRSSAVEEYRLCPRRAPGDVACQATLGPRATVDDLQRALAGKHIVMTGDSRVRYQYMDLVDALVHGDFMKCPDYLVHLVASPRSRGSHAAPISPHVVLERSSCVFDPQRALQRHALARDPGLAPRKGRRARGLRRFLSEGGI